MTKKWLGFARLTRSVNGVMVGFATIIGETIATGGLPSVSSMALGFVTAFTISGASMTINDYYDREVDAINVPKRPLPSGLISPTEALVFATFLIIGALVSAALTNFRCLLIAITTLIISIGYNTKGKKMGLPGNFMVSACVGVPFMYGGFAVTASGNMSVLTLVFTAMAFLSNTGREITKGIPDIEGDELKDIRTIAVVFGSKIAALFSVIFYVSAVGLSVVPLIWSSVSRLYLPIVIISDVGFIVTSVSLLRNHSGENALRAKNLVRIWMIVGLVAFAIGAIR